MKNIAGTTCTGPQIKDSMIHYMICNKFIMGGVQERKMTEMGPKKDPRPSILENKIEQRSINFL